MTSALLLALWMALPQAGTGAVTGLIRTADGEPAVKKRVAAMAAQEAGPSQSDSGTVLTSVAETDSSGHYRLENIPPGRYYVVAGGFSALSYYPSGSGPAEAKAILVEEGRTVSGIDFSVPLPGGRGRAPTQPGDFLIAFIVIGGAAAVITAVWYFSRKKVTQRAIRRIPRTSVRDAVQGQTIKVVGRVRIHGQALEAPLSGRLCAQYRTTVAQRFGKSSTVIVREEQAIDFLIEDNTGSALIHMKGATVAIDMDKQSRSGLSQDADVRMESLLARHGKSSTGWWGINKSLLFEEGVLTENKEIAVVGRAHWEPGKMQDESGEPPRRLVITAGNDSPIVPMIPVMVSDDKSVLTPR